MYTPFKMKGKSPMMKALIGGQKNLAKNGAPELQAAIEASPATMKKESMAKMKKAPAKMKKESMAKMKKESSMKMMDKKSPTKKMVRVDGKLVRETKEMRDKRLANTSGARRRAFLEKNKKNKNLNKKQKEDKKKKENSEKLLKDYNNPKRKDPLANLTGPKKNKVQKVTENLVEKNPKKVKTVEKATPKTKKVVKKDDVKVDPLTKNITNTNQKGDEGLKATVKNKPKVRVVNKNKQGKVNVFSAKYKSMTNSQRRKFYGADYKTRK